MLDLYYEANSHWVHNNLEAAQEELGKILDTGVNLVLIGKTGTGKSRLMQAFSPDTFITAITPTYQVSVPSLNMIFDMVSNSTAKCWSIDDAYHYAEDDIKTLVKTLRQYGRQMILAYMGEIDLPESLIGELIDHNFVILKIYNDCEQQSQFAIKAIEGIIKRRKVPALTR